MVEKETIFSSKMKYTGLLNFQDFYKFCYDWLAEEFNLLLMEKKYVEKLSGDSKNIDIEWEGLNKVTDYFRYQVKVEFKIIGLTNVEITKDGRKVKMNQGSVEVKIKGTLQRDYQGKFERTAFTKFLRGIYERWVIPARIDQFEGKLISDCDEFLTQAKSFLDLEGKR